MSNETLRSSRTVASGAAIHHKPLTAVQRRAEFARLMRSLAVPQRTSIKTAESVVKEKPGVGAFATS
jgi:hypothetical protein